MVGVLIISHGRLATELLAAARTIEPALIEQSRAITLEWNLDPEAGRYIVSRTDLKGMITYANGTFVINNHNPSAVKIIRADFLQSRFYPDAEINSFFF